MRHSALEFARRVDAAWQNGKHWDVVFATDMLNFAEFRGQLQSSAKELPTIVYFHENQLEYPNQTNDPRDFHFGFTNFTTAVAADEVWFNSAFNRDTMRQHLERLSKKWPDFSPYAEIKSIWGKAHIEPPGIEIDELCELLPANSSAVSETEKRVSIHILWAARWEHDKNPKQLLEILEGLDESGIDFRLSVIGQSYRNVPIEFEKIHQRFTDAIVNWGFQSSRSDYVRCLTEADVFLSTANHEFFGITTVEAIASGLIPVLPNRQSYPELMMTGEESMRELLFESTEHAIEILARISKEKLGIEASGKEHFLAQEFRKRYAWKHRASVIDERLVQICKSN